LDFGNFFWRVHAWVDLFILGSFTGCFRRGMLWRLALSQVEVRIAYAMWSLGCMVNALAASTLFGEQLTPTKFVGIGISCLGVFVLARN
jgi:multidrug transporter EmrE-like cation transporter